jgi:cellulose synthase (UDP-forming)
VTPVNVLPEPPHDEEKYLYTERHLPYLATVMTASFVAATFSQAWFEYTSRSWPFTVFTVVGLISFGLSLPLSFTGKGFSLEEHIQRIVEWHPREYPTADVYLPICGEPEPVLRNTWHGVREMVRAYPGRATPWVLDDGADPAAKKLAAEFGFPYIVRPDRGMHKKSGNLRHAFAATNGEFFVILDADFAPRHDFLTETMPYFDDASIAIVQTPQYFRTARTQTWVERAAGAVQEVFYRSIQVARDRLGASICVGTCAVYRREALAAQGGTTLIPYAEDVHTGLDVRRQGWRLVYVPILLATGTCPDNLDMFVRQQYRWCTGSTSTLLTNRLWTVPMSLKARLTYVSGFAYYLQTALATFAIPMFPIVLLITRPNVITLANSRLIILAFAASTLLLPMWNITDYDPRDIIPLVAARSWAHALAIWDYLRGKTMDWQSSRGGVSQVRRFRVGVIVWNGGTALAWLGLALWRTQQVASPRYAIMIALGLCYAAGVTRLIREFR